MRHAKCASAAHGRTPFDRRTRGFSLLEVLVAFVILALVGTTLFRLFGASLNNVGMITLPGDRGKLIIAVFIKKSSKPFDARELVIADISRALYDYYLFGSGE